MYLQKFAMIFAWENFSNIPPAYCVIFGFFQLQIEGDKNVDRNFAQFFVLLSVYRCTSQSKLRFFSQSVNIFALFLIVSGR
jgi:hypothetical protein